MRNARPTLRALENADMATQPKKVQITTALPSVQLVLPKMVMLRDEGGVAHISWPMNQFGSELRPSSEGCLRAFLELGQASDAQVVEFTMKWGVLLLEKIQRKYRAEEQFVLAAPAVTLSRPAIFLEIIKQRPEFREYADQKRKLEGISTYDGEEQWKEWPVDWDCEPVEVYRRYAVQAGALLHIAARLTVDEPADFALWQQAIRPEAPSEFHWPTQNDFKEKCRPQRDLDIQRHLLGKLVTLWIDKSILRPQFLWHEAESPQIGFNVGLTDYGQFDRGNKLWNSERALFRQGTPTTQAKTMPLFNVLTLQLLAMLTSRNGLHVCSGEGCTNVFAPEVRRPRYDQGRYCSDECRENAQRKRSKESERRKRAKRRDAEPKL